MSQKTYTRGNHTLNIHRTLLMIFIVALALCLWATQARATPYFDTGLLYSVSDNKVTITGIDTNYSGERGYALRNGTLTIPATIDGNPVVAIADGTLSEPIFKAIRTDLERLDLSAATNLKRIGAYAFYACSALKTMSIPAVETIGDFAFSACSALSMVNMPVVKTVDEGAFAHCVRMETVSMPAAETLGKSAFFWCIELRSVNMPMVKTVGGNAFSASTKLKTVNMPAITSIQPMAFYVCVELDSIYLTGSAAFSVAGDAFFGCDNLVNIYLPNNAFLARVKEQMGSKFADYVKVVGAEDSKTIALTSTPLTGGSTTGDGQFWENALIPIEAQANLLYVFDRWLAGTGTVRSVRSARTIFTVGSASETVTAKFKRIAYNVQVTVDGNVGGTVSIGSGTDTQATESTMAPVTITATPMDGYQFIGWTSSHGGGKFDEPAHSQTTYTMPDGSKTEDADDLTLTAKFEPGEPMPVGFKIPTTFTVTMGIPYDFSDWIEGEVLNAQVSATLPKYLNVSGNTLTGIKVTSKKKPSIVTVTVDGTAYTTKMQVVANKFTQKKPLREDYRAVYSSTNTLYYKNNELYANVFLLNLTSEGIKGSDDLVLKIYDGEKLIGEQKQEKSWSMKKTLKKGKQKTFLFKITENDLPGVPNKPFNLPSGKIRVVLEGTTRNGFPVIPIIAQEGTKIYDFTTDIPSEDFEDAAGIEDIEEVDGDEVDNVEQ